MQTLASKKEVPAWKKEYGNYWLFALIFVAALCLWLHPDLKGADITRYLYWTRSLFFDQDLLLINEFEMFGERLLLTPTGYAQEFHNFGTAIFWLPFYAVAYLIDAFIFNSDPTVRTGYEPIYILLINFSTWLYAGITLLMLYGLVRRYSSGRAAFWAIVFVSLGTSFFYYVVFLPISSHIASAFLATVFLTVWDTDRKQPRWPLWLTMGAIGGWLLAVANYNVPYLLLPLFTALNDVYKNGFHRYHLKLASVYAVSGTLAFMPQLFIWWLYFGSPLTTPYSDQLVWLDLYKLIFLTWFSGWHGLFVFSPIIYLSILGFYYLFGRDKILALSLVFLFLAFSYVANSNQAWPAGTAFGSRYFISLTPILAIGLAVCLHHFKNPLVYLLAGLLSVWTVLLYAQTVLGLMNLHNWYPIGEIISDQGRALQQLPYLVYEAHLPVTTGPLFRVVIGLAVAGGLIVGLGPWFIKTLQYKFNENWLLVLPGLAVILIVFIGYAGANSQVTQSRLVKEGYYQGKQQIYISDPLDAMKNYKKLADFYLKQGQPEQAMSALRATLHIWPNRSRQFISEDALSQLNYHPLDINFGNVVRLIGYSLDKTDSNNLSVNLYWQRLAAKVDDVYYTFSIVDYTTGQQVAHYQAKEGLIGPSVLGVYPLDHIPDGIFFSDRFDVSYRAEDGLLSKIVISMAEVGLYPRLPDASTPETATIGFIDLSPAGLLYPLNYNFDHKIALTGYRAYLDETGQTLHLALRWQGITPPAKDYKIFTHVLDSNNDMIAQRDVDPLSGLRPTATWKSEEEILDVYTIPLPGDVSLEMATILLGFYLLETGERLLLVEPADSSSSTPQNFVRLEIK